MFSTAGEVGLLIGKYIPEFDFQMYKSKKDLDSPKIIRNAFVEGDKYFNTGDLIYTDDDYFAYFSDRIGDTFRLVTIFFIQKFEYIGHHIG